MLSLLALLALLAADPVARAESLAARGEAEALLLELGSVQAKDLAPKSRRAFARALIRGARGARQDRVVAAALLEKALAFDRTAEGLVLLAELEQELEQREAAAEHLDAALALEPKNRAALLARGALALEEGEAKAAVGFYERAVAAGAPQARAGLEKARAASRAREEAVSALETGESSLERRLRDAERNAAREWIRQLQEEGERERLAPGGTRRQQNAQFSFSFSSGNRNAGELLDFERKVEKVLERTYDFVSGELDHRLSGRTEVLLLTREEYATQFGGQGQLAGAAGFWDGRRIVINGGSEVDERFAEVMVHEFAHAVVSDLAAGRATSIPRWLNEGIAENLRLAARGRAAGRSRPDVEVARSLLGQGRLPRLSDLDRALLGGGPIDIHSAYAVSSAAVRLLIEKASVRELGAYVSDVGRGARPLQALAQHFMGLEELEGALREGRE